MIMNKTFKNFHAGLIDYAGLFPPASLPLEKAVENYLRYLSCDDVWMLGSFILLAKQIEPLAEILKKVKPGEPLAFSLLPGEDLTADLVKFKKFADDSAHDVSLQAIEFRLTEDDAVRQMEQVMETVAGAAFVYFEKPAGHDLDVVIASAQRLGGGFKLRCGGVEASMIPSPEAVARCIARCVSERVPMKFTAGLHHPVRHFSEIHGAMLHGFTNIFAATMFCFIHGLNRDQVMEILTDESADSFRFTESGLTWKHLVATADDLAQARKYLAHSYGSCSFDEPREDLTSLGWLA